MQCQSLIFGDNEEEELDNKGVSAGSSFYEKNFCITQSLRDFLNRKATALRMERTTHNGTSSMLFKSKCRSPSQVKQHFWLWNWHCCGQVGQIDVQWLCPHASSALMSHHSKWSSYYRHSARRCQVSESMEFEPSLAMNSIVTTHLCHQSLMKALECFYLPFFYAEMASICC